MYIYIVVHVYIDIPCRLDGLSSHGVRMSFDLFFLTMLLHNYWKIGSILRIYIYIQDRKGRHGPIFFVQKKLTCFDTISTI